MIEDAQGAKLRFGQRVQATDGVFGELDDVVIDGDKKTVTHIVAQPSHQHRQARLIPIRYIRVDGDTIMVDLTILEIRDLQRVAYSEYVRVDQPMELEDGWDVGFREVLAAPIWSSGNHRVGPMVFGDEIDVSYDRIPKGECEIRRRSFVLTADDHVVGTVEGLLAHGEDLLGVVIATGRGGPNTTAPISAVALVRSDEIRLTIDLDGFRRLGTTEAVAEPGGQAPVDRDLPPPGTRAGLLSRSALSLATGLGKTFARQRRDRGTGSQPDEP